MALVDDDLAVLDSLKFLLETAGYTVATYSSATAFLADRTTAPACLIVDQHMPSMSGLELLAHLRQEATGVPALMITGSPSAAVIARANQLGVAVLEKPPAEADLFTFIDAHV
ncbi:MAG: response regulator [Acetobacteraceae bacterium]